MEERCRDLSPQDTVGLTRMMREDDHVSVRWMSVRLGLNQAHPLKCDQKSLSLDLLFRICRVANPVALLTFRGRGQV